MKKKLYLDTFNIPIDNEEEHYMSSTFYTTVKRKDRYSKPTLIKNLIIEYRSGSYKDMFGLTLKEFLALSKEDLDYLREVRDYIVSEENEYIEEIMEDNDEVRKKNEVNSNIR